MNLRFAILILFIIIYAFNYSYAQTMQSPEPSQLSCEDKFAYLTKYATNIDQERAEKAERNAILMVDKEKLQKEIRALAVKIKELEAKIKDQEPKQK